MSNLKSKIEIPASMMISAIYRTENPKPLLQMDLWQVSQLHKLMVRSYRQSQRALQDLHRAVHEAGQTRMEIYSALIALETDLADLHEKHGISLKNTEWITVDTGEEEAEDAS
jgi:hypothetical protein